MDLAALGAGIATVGGPAALAMKLLTLAGVTLAALGLASTRLAAAARLRCFGLAAAGVGLMYANALIASDPLAALVSMAYVVLTAAALRDGLARRQRAAGTTVAAPGTETSEP